MRSGSCALPKTQECRRFKVQVLPSHAEMQMWASEATARSTLRDGGTFVNGGALLDQKFREMHVQREDGLPVINHDEAAFEVHSLCDHDSTGVGCRDLCTHGGRIIETLVHASGLSVVNPPRAE